MHVVNNNAEKERERERERERRSKRGISVNSYISKNKSSRIEEEGVCEKRVEIELTLITEKPSCSSWYCCRDDVEAEDDNVSVTVLADSNTDTDDAAWENK